MDNPRAVHRHTPAVDGGDRFSVERRRPRGPLEAAARRACDVVGSGGQRQRVVMANPAIMRPKPAARFQRPHASTGYC